MTNGGELGLNGDAAIWMSGVSFAWPGKNAFALSIDTFTLLHGERLLIVGPSGGGKSTFLSLLAGIVTPQAGVIEVSSTDIAQLRGGGRDRFRAEHFGIIFQMFNLLPYGSALDNILLPLRFSPARAREAAKHRPLREEAIRLMTALGLDPATMANAVAARLSVGQQQRVAAARALIGSPGIIVADEPTSSLDRDRQRAFLDVLFAVVGEAGSSLVMVSHDETPAPLFSRVMRLDTIAQSSTRRRS